MHHPETSHNKILYSTRYQTVILPILIFGSSFSSDLHLFLKQLVPVRFVCIHVVLAQVRKQAHAHTHSHTLTPIPIQNKTKQVLTLAGPAVLVNTALLGLTAKYVFPYGWDWPMALLVASMLR